VVVSPREASGACSALLVDRKAWRANGAISLRWVGDRYELSAARPPGYERPWARPPRVTAETDATTPRPAARDAMPRTDDLDAGD
jgi:competence protein ComEC